MQDTSEQRYFVKQSHLFHKSRHLMKVYCFQMLLYHFAPVEDCCYSFHSPYSYFSTSVLQVKQELSLPSAKPHLADGDGHRTALPHR